MSLAWSLGRGSQEDTMEVVRAVSGAGAETGFIQIMVVLPWGCFTGKAVSKFGQRSLAASITRSHPGTGGDRTQIIDRYLLASGYL